MATSKNPPTALESSPFSVLLRFQDPAAALSAINRLRTLEDSVTISLRGGRSSVLRILDTVPARDTIRDSVQVSLRAKRSAAIEVLKGIAPGVTDSVSALLSIRGAKPVGDA